MVERQWVGTGHVHQVDGADELDNIPDYDPRTGAHLWVVTPVFRIDVSRLDDPTHTPYLDTENLIYISPVFCYWCEQPFSRRLKYRRCEPVGMEGKA